MFISQKLDDSKVLNLYINGNEEQLENNIILYTLYTKYNTNIMFMIQDINLFWNTCGKNLLM